MKNILKISLICFGLSVSLFSCTKEEIESKTQDITISDSSYQNEEVYLSILEQGYSEESIERLGNYYIVEGDMVFEKSNNYIDKFVVQSSSSSQLRINSDDTKVGNVSFYIFPGILNEPETHAAFLLAMERWNNVLVDIQLSITTNRDQATTDVKFDTEAESENEATFLNMIFSAAINNFEITSGLAQIGNRDRPGSDIWLNEDIDHTGLCYLSTEDTRFYELVGTIQHEIGHVLGFHHTDSTNGIHIEGSSFVDENSIINSITRCTANRDNLTRPFTDDDIIGIQTIYGTRVEQTNFITSPASSHVSFIHGGTSSWNHFLRWDISLIPESELEIQVFRNGTEVYSATIPNNGFFITPQHSVSNFDEGEVILTSKTRRDSYTWFIEFD